MVKKKKAIKKVTWGDRVREKLANPDSLLSKVTREFNAYKRLVKSDPDRYKFTLFAGSIFFNERSYGKHSEYKSEMVSSWSWVKEILD